MSSASQSGFLVIAAGCCLPVMAFFAAHAYVAYMHSIQPTPPNQGAMVIAYLGFIASIPLGVIIVGIGGVILFRSRRKSHAK